jgi:hypothetical protein
MAISVDEALEIAIYAYLRYKKTATKKQIEHAFSGWELSDNGISDALIRMVNNRVFVQKKTFKPLPPWCHGRNEPPSSDFQFGPLEGTLNQVALCIRPGKKLDTRPLKKKANKTIWIRRHHRTLYQIWFKHANDFQSASKCSK